MLIVQKYGGATLSDPEKIKAIAKQISNLKKEQHQVVVVVSAMGQTTNQLIDLARAISTNPDLRELDMLLSVGERISMSLVSMALIDLGAESISFTGSQAGIITDNSHLNATILDVRAFRIDQALKNNKIVILAGFQGVSETTKEITTLGRGGSDTTAVAMAAYLKADRCEILKDVSSIFSADPKIVPEAYEIKNLNYDHLLEMTFWGAKVLHYRSVELAKVKNIHLYVGPAHDSNNANQINFGTTITKDFMFETSKPLAINSHHQVLKVNLKAESLDQALTLFFKKLDEFNISRPQILQGQINQDNKTYSIFITAPEENLKLIDQYETELQMNLEKKKFCSVSLTCTGSSLNQTLLQTSQTLTNLKIKPELFIQSAMSLNYVIDHADKNRLIKAFHQLIEA